MTPDETQHVAFLKEKLQDMSREDLIGVAESLLDDVLKLRNICLINKSRMQKVAEALGVDVVEKSI
jgi:hypothetical protein